MNEQQLFDIHPKPDITDSSFNHLLGVLAADAQVKGSQQDRCQLDPRDGSMIIYAEHRSLRQDEHSPSIKPSANACPICQGNLTQVIDYAAQSEGFTFISQNMFPVLYPATRTSREATREPLYSDPEHLGREAFGFHLLQWTSSIHNRDWHNMPAADVLVCMQRLQRLEHILLRQSSGYMPITHDKKHTSGYVSIIKNYGAAAGASLTHGHQQIAFSNIMPKRMFNNAQFYQRHLRTFSDYLWNENPASLTVANFGSARIIVPYFMRRPFNVAVLLKTEAEHLHELDEEMLKDLTEAMQKTIKVFHRLLPDLGRDVSYNMAIHTGPNNHVYVEFFPMVQTNGGFERIGLWICQLSAQHAADQLKDLFRQV